MTTVTEIAPDVYRISTYESDFASRAPRWIPEEDILDTGKCRFRLHATHHLPHSSRGPWQSCMGLRLRAMAKMRSVTWHRL
jgi:hypothetical protein